MIHTAIEIAETKKRNDLKFSYLQFSNILMFNFFTGARSGEIMGLKWEDLNFEQRVIHIQRNIRSGRVVLPKNGKTRYIDMLPQAKEALCRQRNLSKALNSEYVFLSRERNNYTKAGNLNHLFKAVLKKSGLRSGVFYDTRSTFVTLMSRLGMPDSWIKQQIGHSDGSVMDKHYRAKIKMDFSEIEKLKIF